MFMPQLTYHGTLRSVTLKEVKILKKQSLRTKVRSAVSVLLTSIMILTSVIPFSFAEVVSISDGNDISSEAVSDGKDVPAAETAVNNESSDEIQNGTQNEAVGSDENVAEDKNDSINDQTDDIIQSGDADNANNSVSGGKDADESVENGSSIPDRSEDQVKDNKDDQTYDDPSKNIDTDEDQEQDEEGFIDRLIDKVASMLGLDGVEWDGSGSESDPYKISTRADLMLLAEKVNGGEGYADKYFVLTNDIDTTVIPAAADAVNVQDAEGDDASSLAEDAETSDTPEKWTPVGTATKTPFKGHFDGAGNTVKIYINTTDSYQGLFGCINGAEIKDLTVSGSITAGLHAGGIAAYTEGAVNIENCVNNADITSTVERSYVGGIVGDIAKGTPVLKGCVNNGNITVDQKMSYPGGILGYTAVKTTISDCRNNGDVISEAASMSAAAGILAYVSGSDPVTFENCINNGTVTSNVGNAAGIIAKYEASAAVCSITDCSNTGKISGRGSVAGLAGSGATEVSRSFNTGAVIADGTGQSAAVYAAGLVADIKSSKGLKVSECYNTGNISVTGSGDSGSLAAGLVACAKGVIIINSYNQGDVAGIENASGLANMFSASNGSSRFIQCYNTGNVSAEGSNKGSLSYTMYGDADHCYYLAGTGSEGGYSEEEMKGDTVVNGLGFAFVKTDESYPELYWQHEASSDHVTLHYSESSFDANLTDTTRNVSISKFKESLTSLSTDREGVTFEGWYTDSKLTEKWDQESELKSGDELFASWKTTAPVYEDLKVTFDYGYHMESEDESDSNENTIVNSIVKYGEAVNAPEAHVRDGYTFLGWYEITGAGTDNEYQAESMYDFSSSVKADLYLRAVWQKERNTDYAWYFDDFEAKEYHITDPAQLLALAKLVRGDEATGVTEPVSFEGKTLILDNDINLSMLANSEDGTYDELMPLSDGSGTYNWSSVIGESADKPFSGTFDGAGFAITGLYIKSADADQALFGYLKNATVKDLTVYADVKGGDNTAAVAANADSTVFENITVEGKVSAKGNCGAGIAASATGKGSFSNCVNRADVTVDHNLTSNAAGICGTVPKGDNNEYSFNECFNEGEISGSKYAAGIVSSYMSANGDITYCGNRGHIEVYSDTRKASTATGAMVGGVIGYASPESSNVKVSYCYNAGSIEGHAYVASVSDTISIGGIAGSANSISHSYNTGSVNAEVRSSTVSTSKLGKAGGIAGVTNAATASVVSNIVDCYNTGNITTSTDQPGNSYYAGGILGSMERPMYSASGKPSVYVTNCYNAGIANGKNINICPGYSSDVNLYVNNCYSLSEKDDLKAGETTEKYMKTEAFAELLGYAYSYRNGAYPVLKWESTDASENGYIILNYNESRFYELGGESGLVSYQEADTRVRAVLSEEGKITSEPSVTSNKESFSFDGWYYADGRKVNFADDVFESGTEIHAEWKLVPIEITYDLNYEADGQPVENVTVPVGLGEYAEAYMPVRDDYSLNGWYLVTDPGKESESVASDKFDFANTRIFKPLYLRAKWQAETSDSSWYSAGQTEYEISTAEQLIALARITSGQLNNGKPVSFENCTIKLTENITLPENYMWPQIGSASAPFKGNFDGNGHTVSGVEINDAAAVDQGFFGYVTGGSIRNLTVEGNITGSSATGGIVGHIASGDEVVEISDVTSKMNVTGTNNTGGIVGQADSNVRIKNCVNEGTVTGTGNTGGVIGSIVMKSELPENEAAFRNVINKGKITGNGKETGGIVGHISASAAMKVIFKDCENSGEIKGTSSYTGGIAGHSVADTATDSIVRYLFDGCINNGKLTGVDYTGGMTAAVGVVSKNAAAADFVNCINNGDIKATKQYVGGMTGYTYASAESMAISVEGCSNTAVIDSSSQQYVSGLIGYAKSYVTISDSNNTGEIKALGNAGGLIGYGTTDINIYRSYNSGDITTGKGTSHTTGGLTGPLTSNIIVDRCYNTGNITSQNKYVGALLGRVQPSSSKAVTVTNCYSAGTLKATGTTSASQAGGILTNAGTASKLTVKNCFSCGSITAGTNYTAVGGILTVPKGTVTDKCYALSGIIGSKAFTDKDVLTAVSTDQLSGGEIAYLLDGGAGERAGIWGQSKECPELINFDNSLKPVYAVKLTMGTANGKLSAEVAGKASLDNKDDSAYVYAPEGSSVTLKATADSGYVLKLMTVKDASGNSYASGSGSDDVTFSMPAVDVVVSADFAASSSDAHKVTLDANGGSFENGASTVTVSVAGDSSLEATADFKKYADQLKPESDQFKFNGWLCDGKAFDTKTVVTEDMTITASWLGLGVDVIFSLNDTEKELSGLSVPVQQRVGENRAVPDPITLTQTGWSEYVSDGKLVYNVKISGSDAVYRVYTLKGWSTEPSGGALWDFTKTLTTADYENGILNLYAQWDIKETLLDNSDDAIPYEINDIQTLQKIAALSQSGETFDGRSFKLSTDLDLSGSNAGKFYIKEFNGNFDGDGHTITLMKNPSADTDLLFGTIGKDGTVENLKLSAADLDTDVDGTTAHWAGLAADNYGLISNCSNDIDAVDKFAYSGGLVYANHEGATIKDCTVELNTAGESGKYLTCIGGIAYSNEGNISNCNTSGDIHPVDGYFVGRIGGIVYEAKGGTIADCTNNINIVGSGSGAVSIAGGIAATVTGPSVNIIENCINNGNITAAYQAGGIVANVQQNTETDLKILNCENTGNITLAASEGSLGAGHTGGIIGNTSYGSGQISISGAKNSGNISVPENTSKSEKKVYANIGGILGYALNGRTIIIENAENTGTVEVESTTSANYSYAGGIAGYISSFAASDSKITESSNSGDIKVTGTAKRVGGIAGQALNIEGCSNTGNIAVDTSDNSLTYGVTAGGIASVLYGEMKNCNNSGNIAPEENGLFKAGTVGGLAGKIASENGVIEGSKNSGKIEVTEFYKSENGVGALVGYNKGGKIEKCESRVDGDAIMIKLSEEPDTTVNNVGGLVGYNTGTVTDSLAVGGLSNEGKNVNVGAIAGSNSGSITNSYFYSKTYSDKLHELKAVAASGASGSMENCYYGAAGWNKDSFTDDSQIPSGWAAGSAFTSGEIAYRLDGGTATHRNVWTQDESAGYPALGSPSYYLLRVKADADSKGGKVTVSFRDRSISGENETLYVPYGDTVSVTATAGEKSTLDSLKLNDKVVSEGNIIFNENIDSLLTYKFVEEEEEKPKDDSSDSGSDSGSGDGDKGDGNENGNGGQGTDPDANGTDISNGGKNNDTDTIPSTDDNIPTVSDHPTDADTIVITVPETEEIQKETDVEDQTPEQMEAESAPESSGDIEEEEQEKEDEEEQKNDTVFEVIHESVMENPFVRAFVLIILLILVITGGYHRYRKSKR